MSETPAGGTADTTADITQAQDDDRVEAPGGDRVPVDSTPLQAQPVLVVDFGAQ